MAGITQTSIISHWNTMLENLPASSKAFYSSLEQALQQKQIPGIRISRVTQREGSILSARREYLQIKRNEHVYHVCGAPFGNGFFVSSWLGEIERGLRALLARLPFVGVIFQKMVRPMTYYRIDTALMFQSLTHSAVLEVVDQLTQANGVRSLTELERKPMLRDFFAR